MKPTRNRGFVARLFVLGLGGLILFAWYALNFRPVADTPEMTKMRLIKSRAVHVAAQVVHPFDPSYKGGRGASPPQSKYIFKVGEREYSGWYDAPRGTTNVEITYCSDNPALHCVGNADQYLTPKDDGFSLGFVIGTALAFGLGVPLLWAGLKM